ncbi:Uncharacterized conserved protein [Nitrosomonas marina]|uniref:Uncharacterized conserved protein n=1 Tax=Nitrosomonas marina TaxID=917 RepID=A0A1I0FZU5_9PROT|nr:CRISPR system precrRNA processing endoribonuclease RAMP protein Cas6 [Nitrosomonas marina]SET63114.1 Uncharacterized conserved protein [Nitrosomonas marina]
MVLLELHLTLHSNQPESAVSASPFLGGIFHGTFERLTLTHAPVICHELGITSENQPKRYAILPQPFDGKASRIGSPCKMKCGIMLYGQAEKYIQVIIALLKEWREIRYDGRTDTVQCDQIRCYIPSNDGRTQIEPDNNNFSQQIDCSSIHSSANSITLHFSTPLKLGDAYTPSLLRIVRSIANRIRKLEPSLANTLGIGSLAWIEAEENIRQLPITDQQLEFVNWRYYSTNRPYGIPCNGLIGKLHYTGHIPACITNLLYWGQWFGGGQSTAMGQGMYYINTPLIKFNAAE